MTFLSIEKIALNVLSFMQDVGSWVCIGSGIVLIIAGIVFATQRAVEMTPAGAASRVIKRQRRTSVMKPVLCFAIGGVLAYGSWTFVKELTRHAYLHVLALVIEEDPGYTNAVKNIDDLILNEPTVDEVLNAFEISGGVLADGFRQSIEKTPDILGHMNKVLIKVGLSRVDEDIAEKAVNSITQINSKEETTQITGAASEEAEEAEGSEERGN